jgi:glycosyltransferase involved in cell wall biosynthesis
MRVLRIYHGGRDASHRARERALVEAGIEVILIVPSNWPEPGSETVLSDEPFRVVELPVVRAGDVNRHRYIDRRSLADAIRRAAPDVVDIHEEPVSSAMHQILAVVSETTTVVGYTAQNLDKRYPPPFNRWQRDAFARLAALYPCSRQAASVARRRGYKGFIEVLPLGHDAAVFPAGEQRHDDNVFQLALAGRMVPEKGVMDAIEVLAAVRRHRNARLVIVGEGPETTRIPEMASRLGVVGHVELRPWADQHALASLYRSSHVVLMPSRATSRWVEQFGRGIVESQASGAVVAAYASGAIPETAAGGACLASEGDVEGLSRAVSLLAGNEAAWVRLRNQGLVAADAKRWAVLAEDQIGLYARALSARPARPRPSWAGNYGVAMAEFGASAHTETGQSRPFALPGPLAGRSLARLSRV